MVKSTGLAWMWAGIIKNSRKSRIENVEEISRQARGSPGPWREKRKEEKSHRESDALHEVIYTVSSQDW